MCVQGRGIWDGPVDAAAIKDLVARVKAHGMTPMLELHWAWGQYTGNSAGCSDVHAGRQKPMPDMRYTPAFWASVASTFKDDPTVVFDLFNEPWTTTELPRRTASGCVIICAPSTDDSP